MFLYFKIVNAIVSAVEISFRKLGIKGYAIRIEEVKEEDYLKNYSPQKQDKSFMFKFDIQTMSYKGNNLKNGYKNSEYEDSIFTIDNVNKIEFDEIVVKSFQKSNFEENSQDKSLKSYMSENSQRNNLPRNYNNGDEEFGKGIKTLRLIKQKLIDIEDLKRNDDAEDDEEYEENREIFQRIDLNDEDYSDIHKNDSVDLFKNRKSLEKFLIDQTRKKTINGYLNRFIILINLSLFIIGIINYKLKNDYNQRSLKRQNLVFQSALLSTECVYISNKLFEIARMNEISTIEPNITSLIPPIVSQVREAMNKLIAVQNKIMRDVDNQEYSGKIIEYYTTKSVKLIYPHISGTDTYIFMDISEATQALISKIHYLVEGNYTNIRVDQVDFKYVTINLNGFYFQDVMNIENLFFEHLRLNSDQLSYISISIIVITAILQLSALLVFIPLFSGITINRLNILKIFLEIPHKKNKKILTKLEDLFNHAQIGEELSESEQSEKDNDDEEIEEGTLNLRFASKKKVRKHKFENHGKYYFLLGFLIVSIIVQMYFVADYLINYSLDSKVTGLNYELKLIASIAYKYGYENNKIRIKSLDTKFPIFNTTDSLINFETKISQLKGIISSIEREHNLNRDKINVRYTQNYNLLMIEGSCKDYVSFNRYITIAECEKISDGIMKEGLIIAVSKYLIYLRVLKQAYQYFYNNPNASPSLLKALNYYNISSINQKNNLFNVVSIKEGVHDLYKDFFKPSFEHLAQIFKETIESDFNALYTILLVIYMFFNLILLGIYLFFWIPVFTKISETAMNAKRMIILIPTSILKTNERLKDKFYSLFNNEWSN